MARKAEPVTAEEIGAAIGAIRLATERGADIADRIFKTFNAHKIEIEDGALIELSRSFGDGGKLLTQLLLLQNMQRDARALEQRLRSEVAGKPGGSDA